VGHYLRVLPDLARTYRVIGHGHPKGDWPARLQRIYRRAGINEYVPDFDEVCRRADLYVCDNSSTLFEFAATGRPVLVLNHPDYRRHVEHGLRFWRAATVGIQVDQPHELLAAVARALEDPPEVRAAREAALDVVYAHRQGAAARAAVALTSWAGTEYRAVA
jgi:UDP-N-acetylglucosamine:LPS N-acetylglucosamine transferase